MSNGQAPAGRVTVWIGIASSILTIALTVVNTYTKARIDAADFALKEKTQEFEAKFKERAAVIEESKERTSRYTFVHQLFPDLADKDETKKELTVNLVRLTLTDDEASRLFSGFTKSSNQQLQNAGNAGITIINAEKNSLQLAADKEREGFQNLISEKYDNALSAFQASESAYPTYHQVYELSRLIKSRRQDLNDPSKRKEIFQLIVDNYSYGAPPDLLSQIRDIAK